MASLERLPRLRTLCLYGKEGSVREWPRVMLALESLEVPNHLLADLHGQGVQLPALQAVHIRICTNYPFKHLPAVLLQRVRRLRIAPQGVNGIRSLRQLLPRGAVFPALEDLYLERETTAKVLRRINHHFPGVRRLRVKIEDSSAAGAVQALRRIPNLHLFLGHDSAKPSYIASLGQALMQLTADGHLRTLHLPTRWRVVYGPSTSEIQLLLCGLAHPTADGGVRSTNPRVLFFMKRAEKYRRCGNGGSHSVRGEREMEEFFAKLQQSPGCGDWELRFRDEGEPDGDEAW